MPVPPQQPVVSFFDPNKRDQGLIEYWNTATAAYEPLDQGAPHPNTREFAGFRLGIQAAVPNDDSWVRRVWVTDETSPDWFNYAVKYAAESKTFPSYIRQYREDKKTYTSLARGSVLGSVIKLVLDTPGAGYTPGTFPAVTVTGGGGTGFVGHGIVNLDGSLADLVIDDQGSGFYSAPVVTVESPVSGVTATGTAEIQSQTAYLVAEQAEEFPKDSEFFGLYFNVTRIYETLPGPTLFTTRIDDDGVVVTISTTTKKFSDLISEETIVSGVWIRATKKQSDRQFTGEQVYESRAIPGNPVYGTKVDDDGKIVTTTKTLKDTTTITSSESVAGGNWTRTFKEEVTDLVAHEIVQQRPIPGNPIPSTKLDDDGQVVSVAITLKESSAITAGEILLGSTWTRTLKKDVSDLVSQEIVESRAIPGPIQEGEQVGKWGVEPVTKQKLALATASVDEGYLVRESKLEPFDGSDLVGTKITIRYPGNVYGVDLQGQDYDPRLDAVIPWVQQLRPQAYGIGVNREDINPIDYQHSEVRTIDPEIVQAVLDAYVFSYPGRINVDMPDVLVSVYGTMLSDTGSGASEETGANTFSGFGSISQNLSAQSQASANILFEAYPLIKQFWGNNIPCQHIHFFLPNPIDAAGVLAKINEIMSPNTVLDWPKFNPELVTLIITGGRVSALAKADSQGSYALSGTGETSTAGGGTTYSEERGLTIKTLRISPTIHAEITVSGPTSDTESVTATAYAEAVGLGPLETQSTGPLSVYGSIAPDTIPATIGATDWPTTGWYLLRTDPHPYRYGYIEFHCILVHAPDFPNVP